MKIQNALHGRSQKGSRRLGMAAACPCLGLLFLVLDPGAAMAECSFDSMALLGNGKIYVTKGNEYVRYSSGGATEMDEGYPQRITGGNWGDLPPAFRSGFDSVALLDNGKVYVTKGDQYIRYADAEATEIDEGYPRRITDGAWGDLPYRFRSGFDSMTLLGNGKVYVTKGDEYIRYSGADATEIDEGYPQRITGGNWGDLPRGFRSGFDAMSLFGNDRVYVTRGDRYIRYADAEADEVDEGFPKSLTGGNWGGEEFIAWACSTHD